MGMEKLTLGSLFDGSGGFPLAGVINGIEPKWASEVEIFPIRVTSKRFPNMKHLGDIRDVDGTEIEPVDIITGGSPCQNLSLAGRREGLEGDKSSLFFEMVRVIKEMRAAANGKYPRFVVWENVPGAFSSNKGDDFQAVLQSLVAIAEPNRDIPKPKKWTGAGHIVGDGYSIAWRVLDAQHWGVAQRRKRIYLVCDFGGERATEALFECNGVHRHTQEGEVKGQNATADTGKSTNPAIGFEPGACSRLGGHVWLERVGALRAQAGDNQTAVAVENHAQDGRFKITGDITETLSATMGTGGNNVPFVLQGSMIGRAEKNGPQGDGINLNKSFTLNTVDRHAVAFQQTRYEKYEQADTATTMRATGGVYGGGSETLIASDSPTYSMTTGNYAQINDDKASTLLARDFKDPQIINESEYCVRRLTPLECCRLQGFPDDWCENLETPDPTADEIAFWQKAFEKYRQISGGKKEKTRKQIIKWLQNPYSDSAIYKMWGNGIALPCAVFVLGAVVKTNQTGCD